MIFQILIHHSFEHTISPKFLTNLNIDVVVILKIHQSKYIVFKNQNIFIIRILGIKTKVLFFFFFNNELDGRNFCFYGMFF